MPPDTLRLFVAIGLPGEVRAALAQLQHELLRRGLERLRWVRPEGIHLTLKFLGDTPVDKVAEIERALDEAVKGLRPHELVITPPSWFFQRREPRVLKLDLDGGVRRLKDLQISVEEALYHLDFPRETRPFSPHLTLARVPPKTKIGTGGNLPDFRDRSVRQSFAGAFIIPVREVSLMRSTRTPSGAIYQRLAAFPLT